MKNPIVFSDFHHASLLQSFILLFEKRLGGRVYRPIGREWFDRGYWKVYEHPATVEQFLGIGGATPDGTDPLNTVIDSPHPGVFLCHDIDSGMTNRAMTLETFFRSHIDIVIASLPAHIEPFSRLCAEHQNHPKLIYQIGNSWTTGAGLAKNIMASALINNVPDTINFISYHQEFDTTVFCPNPQWFVFPGANIYSFVNVFSGQANFSDDWQLFQKVEKMMTGWNFKSYGGQCRDGAAHGSKELADKMRESMFIWHTKHGGDGYGHIIHNAAACGKPLIVKKEYYRGKMADALLEDGVTCITIDGLSPDEIIRKIESYSTPEQYSILSHNMYKRFLHVVDFNREAEQLTTFLTRLI